MRIDFTHFPTYDAIRRLPASPPAAASQQSLAARDASIPPVPPPEVLEQANWAARRAARLAEANRELHFRKDEDSSRIIVEVRDLRGTVIRTIPPSSALDLMTGGRSWQA
jgi:hypothetical protein